MRQMLEEKLRRFEDLERMMLDPVVLADSSRLTDVAREHGSIAKLATKYRRFKEINGQIAEAVEMLQEHDPELRELAESELPGLRAEREKAWDELLDMTVGGADATRTRCLLEIRAGTGGDEAALFARDLYEMYRHYAEAQRWRWEVMDHQATELGGFKEVVVAVEGEGVFRRLQYESGGHRVQRVPETEAKGRIHTSAATVAVMPEPEDIEITIRPDDYREDVYHSSGPGGQNVNKVATAIRLTHYETGIVVQCQDEASQHKNRAKAIRLLKARVLEHHQREADEKRATERKLKVGSGDRNARIRTYNYPDNRVTDHRINLTLYKLDAIIAGNLDPVIEACIDYERKELREDFGTVE